MPKYFCDCVVIPIPKSCHDLSSSDNYRPISLASCLSKVLECIVLNQYSSFFISYPLQFSYKSGSSKSLCTGIVKCIYILFRSISTMALLCSAAFLTPAKPLIWLTTINYLVS